MYVVCACVWHKRMCASTISEYSLHFAIYIFSFSFFFLPALCFSFFFFRLRTVVAGTISVIFFPINRESNLSLNDFSIHSFYITILK